MAARTARSARRSRAPERGARRRPAPPPPPRGGTASESVLSVVAPLALTSAGVAHAGLRDAVVVVGAGPRLCRGRVRDLAATPAASSAMCHLTRPPWSSYGSEYLLEHCVRSL